MTFHKDINIITGRNGSGKTSILKLIWYMMSGNIERTVPEIPFTKAELRGNHFFVRIEKRDKNIKLSYSTEAKPDEQSILIEDWEGSRAAGEIDSINAVVAKRSGISYFLPTFRRIEGGYLIDVKSDRYFLRGQGSREIRDALKGYAESMSVLDHHFVTSLSTEDLETLLTKRLADISEKTNDLHRRLSSFINDKIANVSASKKKSTEVSLQKSEATLEAIRLEVESINKKRKDLFAPLDILAEQIKHLFTHKGIRLTDAIVFGEATDAVKSTLLSAGEKQFLSFLCYNGFHENTTFLIDEPEISLHVDWQRSLFSTLLKQGSSNQFIVSTHSPFIYSKFPEKELPLRLKDTTD